MARGRSIGSGRAPERAGEGVEALIGRFGLFVFDQRRHRASLPLIASWLAQAGRHRDALGILDRYHRTGADGPRDRLLEAGLARQLGDREGALAALRRAHALDPEDPATQQALAAALVEAGLDGESRALGRRLLARATAPSVLALALGMVREERPIFGVVTPGEEGELDGWCVWRDRAPRRRLDVLADGRAAVLEVEARPHAQWTPLGFAYGAFRILWPSDAAIIEVRDAATGASLRGCPVMREDAVAEPRLAAGDAEVSVVVPVYDDAAATRRCFDALLADRSQVRRRILVVDDATPNPMIRLMLDRLAADGRIALLRNPCNVGFVRSVNRALRHVGEEDVVLLNADTQVPPGWLDRLRAVAAGDRIGTVTPLSNNGQLVSIPARFVANPMPPPDRVAAIDAAVAAAGGEPVDLPNGVGFCLYLTRAALRAAGPLDAGHFERGYLEEVDLCLRVAQAGLRNVCATTVYVAHQGGASFGAEKADLVAANAAALNRQWPRIEEETAAFLESDPLAACAEATAFALWTPRRATRLAVVAARDADPSDLSALACAGDDVALLAGAPADPRTWRVRLPGLAAWVPPDITHYRVGDETTETTETTNSALRALAGGIGASAILAVVDASLAPAWIDAAMAAGLPVDLLAVDATLACGDPDAADPCPLPRSGGCPRCRIEAGQPASPVLARSRPRLAAARSVLVPSRSLQDLLSEAPSAGRAHLRLVSPWDLPFADAAPPPVEPDPEGVIGIVPPDTGPATFAAIRDLATAFQRRATGQQLVVLGSTMDDVALMRTGNVFVTGPVGRDHPWTLLRRHACRGLVLPLTGTGCAPRAAHFVRASGFPFAATPLGLGLDLIRESDRGLPLQTTWSPDQAAFVIERFLSVQGIAGLRRGAGAGAA